MKVTINVEVPTSRIQDMLVSVFEQQSNYQVEKYHYKEGISYNDFKEGGKFQNPESYYHPMEIIPVTEGCSVEVLEVEDDIKHIVDLARLEKGMQIMAEKYPTHFYDIIEENDDAATASLYMDCVIHGKETYC